MVLPRHKPRALQVGLVAAVLIILGVLIGCAPPSETGRVAQFTGVVAGTETTCIGERSMVVHHM